MILEKRPMLKILVTIAARGGSKGIKGKNIRPLMKKPLIAHTIAQALAWGKATDVIVTTDSPAIAKIAEAYGAQVPFIRPVHLATDTMGKVPVIRHALVECERIYSKKYDVVVDLDVTAPIRSILDLNRCLAMFVEKRPTTIFSVVPSHKNPYFNMIEKGKKGRIKLCKKLPMGIVRRQDAPKVYDANASIYFYERNYLLKSKNPRPINSQCEIYVMDEISGVDVDREIDFKYIEFLVKEGVFKL